MSVQNFKAVHLLVVEISEWWIVRQTNKPTLPSLELGRRHGYEQNAWFMLLLLKKGPALLFPTADSEREEEER